MEVQIPVECKVESLVDNKIAETNHFKCLKYVMIFGNKMITCNRFGMAIIPVVNKSEYKNFLIEKHQFIALRKIVSKDKDVFGFDIKKNKLCCGKVILKMQKEVSQEEMKRMIKSINTLYGAIKKYRTKVSLFRLGSHYLFNVISALGISRSEKDYVDFTMVSTFMDSAFIIKPAAETKFTDKFSKKYNGRIGLIMPSGGIYVTEKEKKMLEKNINKRKELQGIND